MDVGEKNLGSFFDNEIDSIIFFRNGFAACGDSGTDVSFFAVEVPDDFLIFFDFYRIINAFVFSLYCLLEFCFVYQISTTESKGLDARAFRHHKA